MTEWTFPILIIFAASICHQCAALKQCGSDSWMYFSLSKIVLNLLLTSHLSVCLNGLDVSWMYKTACVCKRERGRGRKRERFYNNCTRVQIVVEPFDVAFICQISYIFAQVTLSLSVSPSPLSLSPSLCVWCGQTVPWATVKRSEIIRRHLIHRMEDALFWIIASCCAFFDNIHKQNKTKNALL